MIQLDKTILEYFAYVSFLDVFLQSLFKASGIFPGWGGGGGGSSDAVFFYAFLK